MIAQFQKYHLAGFSCLPTKQDKSPLIPQNWRDGFSEEYFKDAIGIGLICGEKSGGLECMDFDNHFGDAKSILAEFLTIPEVSEIYQKYKLPIEKTQNGGYHLLFRCSKNEGNRKLAQRLNSEGKPDAIIETRGEGGYFVADPTPGYKVIRNDIFKVNVISDIERAILIDTACSMNEYNQVIRTEHESSDRPGDLYNADFSSIGEMKGLLKDAGWVELQHGRWRRPGKKEGISATLGKIAPNIFYVFSSNAYPFEPNKSYSPFQVLAFIKFNGDFSEAARSLPKPEKIVTEQSQKTIDELERILNSAKIDFSKQVERPPIILSIYDKNKAKQEVREKRVFTLGNFSCIIGKAKSKKTFFLVLVTAAMIKNGKLQDKLIGSLPNGKKTILYFDTEQGEYDSYNTMHRIKALAGGNMNFHAYNLRPFSPNERCQIIEYAFKLFDGKIGFCVIDGIADLSNGINEEDEATRVSTLLLKLTKNYNCHIATILHQNKNDNFATGHLGSAIMKKAEIIISVTKNHNSPEQSQVKCDMGRGVDFDDFTFSINNDLPVIDDSEQEDLSVVTTSDYYEPQKESCPF
jgi:hypothetical protein